MKKAKLTGWGYGVIGFYIGLIAMMVFMALMIPQNLTVGDPTDMSVRQTAIFFAVMVLFATIGPMLLATAWMHRKTKQHIMTYAISGIAVTLFFVLFFFGGFILAPFM